MKPKLHSTVNNQNTRERLRGVSKNLKNRRAQQTQRKSKFCINNKQKPSNRIKKKIQKPQKNAPSEIQNPGRIKCRQKTPNQNEKSNPWMIEEPELTLNDQWSDRASLASMAEKNRTGEKREREPKSDSRGTKNRSKELN